MEEDIVEVGVDKMGMVKRLLVVEGSWAKS